MWWKRCSHFLHLRNTEETYMERCKDRRSNSLRSEEILCEQIVPVSLFFVKFFSPLTSVTCVDRRSAVWGTGCHGGRPLLPWINKLTVFMNECSGGSWQASWESLNGGKTLKPAAVKYRKLFFPGVTMWRFTMTKIVLEWSRAAAGLLLTLGCLVFSFESG